MAWTTKSPIRGNHWVTLSCRALLGSVNSVKFKTKPFRQESFGHGCFIMGTFWHMPCSALRTFRQINFSTPERFDMGHFRHGEFWHEEFSAPEHFGTGIFRHLNISAHGYFGTLQSNMDVSAQTFRHLCYCAEMSMCRNVPVPKCSCAENSSCRKVTMSKCSRVEMSICRNVCSAEWCTCRNVPVMKHPCRNVPCRNVPCRNGLKALARSI